MRIENVKSVLRANSVTIKSEERINNNLGVKITLDDGVIINCFDTGKHSVQGRNPEKIIELLDGVSQTISIPNKNVFVVYGHDQIACTQLEAMLRRWGLEPLILDQLASSGHTIIEKLEEYIQQASFGIVLATPDDCGYVKGQPNEMKYRVRQNVVLELGMLLAKIGRSRVAILLSKAEKMERPSDIDGLIYISFENNVEEVAVPLLREMAKFGYQVTSNHL